LIVSAILFVCGIICMATKRNALGVLMGIELILNAANLNFIAFGSPYLTGDAGLGLDGQLIAMFVIVLAAAEAAVALAIALNYYYTHATIDVDKADELKG
jgi:NAD(P)H-quinone oxidoreductase subunit 4L